MTYDFNSHAHVERDRIFTYFTDIDFNFNSHAHVERDETVQKSIHCLKNFNSHAHVERDDISFDVTTTHTISTHTLTWSVTTRQHNYIFHILISTHTLTWSVTDRI